MRKKNIINFMILSSLLIIVISLSFSSNVTAVTSSFTENFSSTTYRDFANSDVSDWGSGEIRISYQEPSELGNYPSSGESLEVAIDGDLAYVADKYNGVMILNISNPLSPSFVGNYTPTLANRAMDVCIDGDFAFIGYRYGGVHVVDISDPYNPTQADIYDIGDTIAWGKIEVIGNYAYVATNVGLYVMDVNNKASISVADNIDNPETGIARGLKISGNYAFVADGNADLWVVDITNPLNIMNIGDFGPGEYSKDVFISGDLAYVSNGIYGLRIFNISNPLLPVSIGHFAGDFESSYVIGNVLYGANNDDGLWVLDISDPTSPIKHTEFNSVGNAFAVEVVGDYVYLADGTNGLQILDLSNIYRYRTEGTAQSSLVFIADAESLLQYATLVKEDTTSTFTSVDYFLSADNGANWESVTPGVLHNFNNPGYILKWKAVLSTTNLDYTPLIDSITISYTSKLKATTLTNPYNGIVTIDDTPLFEWAEITGISSYLIQIDVNDEFLTPIINETVAGFSYEPSAALEPDTYYWRVAGIDAGGDTGIFSEIRVIVIQSLVPEFDFISFSLFTLTTLSIVFVLLLKRKIS
ncbi:MAG: LVIVD repeat-containing protein [Candidatus Heimdallarchaeaceae archaeon]